MAATSIAARHLGLEKEVGKLEVGMRADILVMRGNPLANIADIHQVDAVVQGGKVVYRRGNGAVTPVPHESKPRDDTRTLEVGAPPRVHIGRAMRLSCSGRDSERYSQGEAR